MFESDAQFNRYLWIIVAAAALALCFFMAVALRRQWAGHRLRRAPNSRVALRLPENFKRSDRFSGFIDDSSSASIVVIELPDETFAQIKGLGGNPAALAAQGVTDVETAQLPGRKGDFVYLTGRQQTDLVAYQKFILILRENGLSAIVTANAPEAALSSRLITRAEIEAALASLVVLDAPPPPAPLFTLGHLGRFEEDASFAGMTKGYRLAQEAAAAYGPQDLKPFFIVAPSLHRLPLKDIEDAAAKAFRSLDQFHDARIVSSQRVKLGVGEGLEIVGKGSDWRTGSAAGLYQLMLPAPKGGYFRLVGYCAIADWEAFLPEFRRMAASFKPVRAR